MSELAPSLTLTRALSQGQPFSQGPAFSPHGQALPEGQTLKDLVQEYERQLLLMALELAGWNQRRVAASLGLLPSTLSEKMKRLGLRSTRAELVLNDAVTPLRDEGHAVSAA